MTLHALAVLVTMIVGLVAVSVIWSMVRRYGDKALGALRMEHVPGRYL